MMIKIYPKSNATTDAWDKERGTSCCCVPSCLNQNETGNADPYHQFPNTASHYFEYNPPTSEAGKRGSKFTRKKKSTYPKVLSCLLYFSGLDLDKPLV